MNLDSIIGVADAATVRARLVSSPYRRLSDTPEVDIHAGLLCQSLHVDRLRGEPRLLLGDEAEGYQMHSVESLGPLLERLAAVDIRRVYLGLGAGPAAREPRRRLGEFVEIVAGVRRAAGPGVQLIVDPAGLCMRQDLRWGVTAGDGGVDAAATVELLAQAAVEFAEAGMDTLMTIGRINCEVEVARKALARASRPVELMSFSTNSETASAYFETTRDDVARSRTGQKIIVGNGHEMTLRALGDFGDGSDVVVQKPIEAFQSLVMLRLLVTGQLSVATYLERTAEAERLLASNPWLRPALERFAASLQRGGRPPRTGVYEVSGTYCIMRTLAHNYSEQLAWAMLDETYRNAASAAGSTLDVIISRSAEWYARTKRVAA